MGGYYEKFLRAGIAIGLLSSPAFSGGWETGRLDTSFMYEEGGFGQFGVLSVGYDVGCYTIHRQTSIKWPKTRTGALLP